MVAKKDMKEKYVAGTGETFYTDNAGIAYLHGMIIHVQRQYKKADRLEAALVALIDSFLTGKHYETQNPYTRPEVREAMQLLKELRCFPGDWQDVLKSLPRKSAATVDSKQEDA